MKAFFTTVLYQPLYNVLMLMVWLIPGHSVAVAIILLTIVIRVILLPSSLKAARFQVKNNELQPKINKIKSEIKDPKEQNKAIMDLYSAEGHSPLGSCLPLLIQLPILIILYSVFRNGLTEKGFDALYSFLPHVSTLNTHFLGLDITKPDKWVLPIIAALFQFGLSYLMMPPKQEKIEGAAPDPMAMMSKQMLFLPALITIFFGRTMPAALVIYWIVTTIFSFGQQIYVNKEIKPVLKAKVIAPPKKVIEAPKEIEAEEPKKKNMMAEIMKKRLDKQERKAGVNVTVRTKK